jgi:hypothetical protein
VPVVVALVVGPVAPVGGPDGTQGVARVQDLPAVQLARIGRREARLAPGARMFDSSLSRGRLAARP